MILIQVSPIFVSVKNRRHLLTVVSSVGSSDIPLISFSMASYLFPSHKLIALAAA
jgi:hypothetical protein